MKTVQMCMREGGIISQINNSKVRLLIHNIIAKIVYPSLLLFTVEEHSDISQRCWVSWRHIYIFNYITDRVKISKLFKLR